MRTCERPISRGESVTTGEDTSFAYDRAVSGTALSSTVQSSVLIVVITQ